jgi:hypothetical protein
MDLFTPFIVGANWGMHAQNNKAIVAKKVKENIDCVMDAISYELKKYPENKVLTTNSSNDEVCFAKIKKLDELRAAGVVSAAEYETKRKELIETLLQNSCNQTLSSNVQNVDQSSEAVVSVEEFHEPQSSVQNINNVNDETACSACGAQHVKNAKFCGVCGEKFLE